MDRLTVEFLSLLITYGLVLFVSLQAISTVLWWTWRAVPNPLGADPSGCWVGLLAWKHTVDWRQAGTPDRHLSPRLLWWRLVGNHRSAQARERDRLKWPPSCCRAVVVSDPPLLAADHLL